VWSIFLIDTLFFNIKHIYIILMEKIKSTTVVAIRHNGEVVIGADGQATLGNTIAKSAVKKLRVLQGGKIVTGFAGSTADAFTLLEKFEEKLDSFGNNMKRAAVELAKEWRTDRMLSKLEAMMIVADAEDILIISGNGDVIEPDMEIATIGSGSMFAQSAARAMKKFAPHLTAEEMVRESLLIAADVCIYTNHNLVIEKVIK
jgi:ATP-dependent HslUV protease subunit HslV